MTFTKKCIIFCLSFLNIYVYTTFVIKNPIKTPIAMVTGQAPKPKWPLRSRGWLMRERFDLFFACCFCMVRFLFSCFQLSWLTGRQVPWTTETGATSPIFPSASNHPLTDLSTIFDGIQPGSDNIMALTPSRYGRPIVHMP